MNEFTEAVEAFNYFVNCLKHYHKDIVIEKRLEVFKEECIFRGYIIKKGYEQKSIIVELGKLGICNIYYANACRLKTQAREMFREADNG